MNVYFLKGVSRDLVQCLVAVLMVKDKGNDQKLR